MEEVEVGNAGGDQPSTGDDMVQYVIYSGEGDQPIGLEELRDALTKLTGQPVALQDRKEPGTEDLGNDPQPALSQDNDLNFRLSAERVVGEVSFVDDNIVENGDRSEEKADQGLSKLVIDDTNVSDLLKRQEKPPIPSQITIETEYGPITLETSKLTPGQLEGTEQITVNLMTTDASGDSSKAVTETRGLKLPPGLLAPKGRALHSDADESIHGSDFNSVLQQLTDLCSEQNPLPVQESEKALLKEAAGLDDFMSLKIPQDHKQSGVIEVDKLETFIKSKFGDSAKIQIHPTGVVVEQAAKSVIKPVICCAAHSELKNQETRRCMLPIPLDVTKCPECNKECMNRKNLRLHIQRYHVPDFKHQCQTRARVIPPPPEDIITDIPILVENAEILAEIGEKSAPKAYRCSVCDQQFTTQKEYFVHLEVHGRRPLMCILCGRRYNRASALKNHLAVVHNGVQRFQCKYCMQCFSTHGEWNQHEKDHDTANDESIECLKCHDQIPKNKFRQHVANLHRVVYKAKLDCVFCGTRFKTPEFLASHTQQFHNFEKYGHLCSLCYKAFPSSNERDFHTLRAHTDEEMMEAEVEFSWQPRDCFKRQCARCGTMFNSYAKLKAHYDKHGDEKNSCIICGSTFRWIVNLDWHYKSEHTSTDLVKFGVATPTMNLVRLDDDRFELTPKIGRAYSSRYDLAEVEPSDENENGKIVMVEYTTNEREREEVSSSRAIVRESHVVVRQPLRTQKQAPKPPAKPVQIVASRPAVRSGDVRHTVRSGDVRPTYEFTEEEYKKVLGKTNFDYKKYLPDVDTGSDPANVKAPRHNDIVIGRPATVINLARVWSRRERGLFYMGNEAEKFRRAAATIPKKRIGDKWVEMPLFVDELSGKLVTVEGMAELWRERAQMFLDHLGRGQAISDFLPMYELGQKTKGGKPLAKEVESSVQRNETSIHIVDKKDPSATRKGELAKTTKSGRQPKYTEKAKKFAKVGDRGTYDESEEEEIPDEIDETMFTKKIMVRNEDGTLQEAEKKRGPETRKRGRGKEPEKDLIPDIVSGIKKAKRELKARGKGAAKKVAPAKAKPYTVKGKRGKPPGFNPDRFSPYARRPRLILNDIQDIIGDAKKIIVQIETDHSPERRYIKKQTARKSITRPRPAAAAAAETRESRHSRFEKRETKKDAEEVRRASTRAQKEKAEAVDMVDGPQPRRSRRDKDDSRSEEPQDKGSTGRATRAPKPGDKRNADNASSTPAKKAKTPSVVSPRSATLSGARAKPEPEPKVRTPRKGTMDAGPRATKKANDAVEESKKTPTKNSSPKKTPGRKQPEPVDDEPEIDNSPEREMPTLEIEISSQEYAVPTDSPLPSTSSTSDDISRETKRAMEFLPADFDLEEASLNTSRKAIKMVLHDSEARVVKNVGSALSPVKEASSGAGDSWDVLVGTPTKSPTKNS